MKYNIIEKKDGWVMNREKSKYHLSYPITKIIFVTLATIVASVIVTIFISSSYREKLHYYEVIEFKDNYINFKVKFEKLMETGIAPIAGYQAYLKVNGTLSKEETEEYLEYLLEEYMDIIRNVAIIKDTTIIFNYPYEGNESSIGVDLAQNELQKEIILKTKNDKVIFFQGPVKLVQGGEGYIIRIPIEDSEGSYWGQVSIVLRADIVNQEIVKLATKESMNIAIYNQKDLEFIVGNKEIVGSDPLFFYMQKNQNWIIYVSPLEGWNEFSGTKISGLAMGFLFSLILGAVVFYIQKSAYKLKFALFHDSLTKLYNRSYLENVQKQLTSEAKTNKHQYALIHIDIDEFKKINDQYGHLIGDKVLEKVGEILNKITRSEELVFRVGGDEFLIVAPYINKRTELTSVKERLNNNIDDEFRTDKLLHEISLSLSLGAGLFPNDGIYFDDVLKIADRNMYLEKKKHREMDK